MISLIIEIVLLMLGFTLLSLSMTRHYADVTKRGVRLGKGQIKLLRIAGYLLIMIALCYSIFVWNIALGLVYCFGTASLVSLFISLTLTYRPSWLLLRKTKHHT